MDIRTIANQATEHYYDLEIKAEQAFRELHRPHVNAAKRRQASDKYDRLAAQADYWQMIHNAGWTVTEGS